MPCASPAYSPGLAGTTEGFDCTRPPGAPGKCYRLMLTLDDQVTVTPCAFFSYDTHPALTPVYAHASNATYDGSAASASPVRLPSDWGALLLRATNWDVTKSPSAQVGMYTFAPAPSSAPPYALPLEPAARHAAQPHAVICYKA